jgi:hypothetical protein
MGTSDLLYYIGNVTSLIHGPRHRSGEKNRSHGTSVKKSAVEPQACQKQFRLCSTLPRPLHASASVIRTATRTTLLAVTCSDSKACGSQRLYSSRLEYSPTSAGSSLGYGSRERIEVLAALEPWLPNVSNRVQLNHLHAALRMSRSQKTSAKTC